MQPLLVQLGPVPIYSFGVMLVIGILLSMYVVWKKIGEYHIESDDFFDLSFLVLIWGVVGARAAYILEHFDQFGLSVVKWLWLTNYSGMAIWGGLVAGLITVLLWTKSRDYKVIEVLDLFVIGLSLGQAVGRVGSFLDGSSVGKAANWGIMMAGSGEKLIPIQLFEALGYLLLFLWLWYAERKYRMFEWYRAGKSAARSGFLLFCYLFFAGVIWAASSLFRAEVWYVGVVNLYFVFGLIMMLTGVLGIVVRSGKEFAWWNKMTRGLKLKNKGVKMVNRAKGEGIVGKDWVRN